MTNGWKGGVMGEECKDGEGNGTISCSHALKKSFENGAAKETIHPFL